MHAFSFAPLFVIFFWIVAAAALALPTSYEIGDGSRQKLEPRIGMNFATSNGWHVMVEEMLTAFFPNQFAFWGFERFFSHAAVALSLRSQTEQPTPQILVRIGQLELFAHSVNGQIPIEWDKLIWIVELSEKLVRNGSWPGVEFNGWILDSATGVAVRIGLRVLLDAPMI